ncbi:hypothetical protein Zmor_017022 [Zophobas morio]|uniref:TLC domain-containing protein n=1 Tax=Zophobas morio TaxID=2755281 RepID=A0AA38MCB8_9CUCU|nr:hypothetical protein Zmor_017022 [Zophobas morio]
MVSVLSLLLYPVPGGLAFLCVRYLLAKFLFKPFGLWFGLRNSKPKQVPPNLVLEREFSQSKKWDHHKVVGLSKQLDMSQEKIEEWLSLKQAQVHASVLDKFCDSAWNFFYYATETTLGFLVLWDKPWLWDTDECWRNFYSQIVTRDVWLYFMWCLAYGWSQLFGLTFNIKRRDFYIMVIHHVAFITLLTLSGTYDAFRLITITIFVCDSTDVLLEISKIAKYLGYEKCAFYAFLVFTFWWIVVRVVLFPCWLAKGFIVDLPRIYPFVTQMWIYYVITILCFVFGVANLIWTYFIVKTLIQFCVTGTSKDARSDCDE